MLIRLLQIFVAILLLIGTGTIPLTVQADDIHGLVKAMNFAPFQGLDEDLTAPLPRPVPAKGIYSKRYAPMASDPERPVITPEHTRALIAQIYGGEAEDTPSLLEAAYSKRVIDPLKQFGYEMFTTPGTAKPFPDSAGAGIESGNNGQTNLYALPAGAVQDDFLLNIGDRLTITFRGQKNSQKSYTVNSEGLLLVDDLPPISVAGQTIGAVRARIESEAGQFYNTDVFVALESVRQVSVLVVGHVRTPGRETLTVFHTVLDALMAAGGIEKTGSLRQIKLVRGGRSTIVDLYSLLVHGSAIMDISLRDGDRIIVPPVGPTVAIAGGVKRPGIYELLPEPDTHNTTHEQGQTQTLQGMLNLAGGVLTPGQNRFMKLGLTDDGRETVEEISAPLNPVFGNGSVLVVAPSEEARTGTVELVGHTRRPGIYDLDQVPSLTMLLSSERVLGPDIYPLIGVIERRDNDQLARHFIDFPPLLVIKGDFDRTLKDGDVIHLFSQEQIRHLAIESNQRTKSISYKNPVYREVAYGSADDGEADTIVDPLMISFLSERAAFVRGAVRQEGGLPVAEGTTLENVIAVSGGLTLEANSNNIEVTSKLQGEGPQSGGRSGIHREKIDFRETSPATVLIGPGDTVRVNQKFKRVAENTVTIMGEVLNPGQYDLMPGDKMSDLLRRAGGVSDQAYPDGTIFSRQSERKAEEARFRAQAQELEIKLAAALEQEDEPNVDQIGAVQDLVTQLRHAEAVGRITVEADPAVLAVRPELDILLEAGDKIYIPKRPLTVRVAGEILSPANLQFRKEKDARDYIMEGGGFTYNADKDRVFVLYPDGSAQPLLVNAWNHTPVMIPPGSTVVVPRDPKPFDFIQTARDISQILSNLAITGIFIDDIRND